MTDQEFKDIKATMPWTEQSFVQGRATVIRLVDNIGNEVPLFTILAFVKFMSAHLARPTAKEPT